MMFTFYKSLVHGQTLFQFSIFLCPHIYSPSQTLVCTFFLTVFDLYFYTSNWVAHEIGDIVALEEVRTEDSVSIVWVPIPYQIYTYL